MRRQRCGHPAAHQACHQAGVAGRGETLRTGSRARCRTRGQVVGHTISTLRTGSRARCRTRGQVVGHTISQTSVRLAPSSDLRGSRHDSVSYRIPMSELGVTGDDDACKCESNGASRVCVCMRHSRETGISFVLARLERVSEDVRVDGVRVGTVCARFRGGASAVCLFPFRRRAGHDPVNRAGCSASGRCSRSGTWARDYGQAFFCPTTRNIACNIVITDLSPGCRAVELSRIRRGRCRGRCRGAVKA